MPNLGSIHTYRSEVDQIRRFSGSTRESTLRRAVFNLINAYACASRGIMRFFGSKKG